MSVVVPTYNRWSQLRVVLEALGQQTVPQDEFEVIVVSDGSTDDTEENLVAGNTSVELNFIQQENQGPAAARNTGIAAATGDLVLFIDDDVVAEPECISAHLAMHERSDHPTVVIGPLCTPEGMKLQPWVDWEQRMLYKQYGAMTRGDWPPTARQFYTGNASLRRDALCESGGFDSSFRRGEDVELAYRLQDAGIDFRFAPEAMAFHHASRSYESWLSNATAYGRNDVLMWRDRGQSWLIPTIRVEYGQRRALTRGYIRLGLEVPYLSRFLGRSGAGLCQVADRLGFGPLVQGALSAVYGLAYFDGLVTELGGLDQFLAIDPWSQQPDPAIPPQE